ncbi:hypothetical protein I9054_011075 [Acinetobacter bereziniae]|uniref:Uncharacterized protein n=1 Tax=Acinetobacter bereziniae TaxID=106648 RepID=A0A8I1AMJ1_ACIBZ|nr:hypothetical protein [Acinetobacter bereziniae]QQC86891.1 hypothetical protein I9190_10660 [Acinetobacter bereziniae]UUO00057.1 hypothetical protein I9054_011075 [Acinetobacter bereziniae]
MSNALQNLYDCSELQLKETIIEYTNTNSDILQNCITEYRTVAEKADGHAADAERLMGEWPEN